MPTVTIHSSAVWTDDQKRKMIKMLTPTIAKEIRVQQSFVSISVIDRIIMTHENYVRVEVLTLPGQVSFERRTRLTTNISKILVEVEDFGISIDKIVMFFPEITSTKIAYNGKLLGASEADDSKPYEWRVAPKRGPSFSDQLMKVESAPLFIVVLTIAVGVGAQWLELPNEFVFLSSFGFFFFSLIAIGVYKKSKKEAAKKAKRPRLGEKNGLDGKSLSSGKKDD
mmetsp:Transcript_26200/g.63134  ORF Transcript_26200/g.63134 Transcript_26200/m.63134 type:complete len:225 (+) Transcript_26200:150-824(+)|eukprot:CAMPEP_0114524928 /NCGR_PEP_ID=MMETSP0109-20121206/22127_1 /TAXON_ID=29199 /ORGANISM="Chlorarachnion reptans, Strain CCCM449" /LENGTH=224 /DNA_ID=CAMNT_0001706425 /DNA_START=89 /DNA_END=763 /DNA_ORIENTATION=+